MGTPDRFREFVDLVSRMRTAQADYFKLKTKPKLDAALKLEREVDQVISCIRRPSYGSGLSDGVAGGGSQ